MAAIDKAGDHHDVIVEGSSLNGVKPIDQAYATLWQVSDMGAASQWRTPRRMTSGHSPLKPMCHARTFSLTGTRSNNGCHERRQCA